MNEKTQYDYLHDEEVTNEFFYVVDHPDWNKHKIIKNYSQFIKKSTTASQFEIGEIYIGTRICYFNEKEFEESVVLYIEDISINDLGKKIITALTVYREILHQDQNNKIACVQEIHDSCLYLYSRFYNVEEIDGAETVLYNKAYPTEGDYGIEDLAGVRISANTKAEFRGWWLIKENYLNAK